MNVSVAEVSVVDTTLSALTVPGTGGGTAGVTVSVAAPETPLLAVAVIVAVPMPTLTANPLLEIATIVESLLVHLTGCPASGLPLLSFATASSCSVAPSTPLVDVAVRVMDATALGVTVPGPK